MINPPPHHNPQSYKSRKMILMAESLKEVRKISSDFQYFICLTKSTIQFIFEGPWINIKLEWSVCNPWVCLCYCKSVPLSLSFCICETFSCRLSCAPANTETKLSRELIKSCLTAWACGLASSPQPWFIFLRVGMKISDSSCSTLFSRPTPVVSNMLKFTSYKSKQRGKDEHIHKRLVLLLFWWHIRL